MRLKNQMVENFMQDLRPPLSSLPVSLANKHTIKSMFKVGCPHEDGIFFEYITVLVRETKINFRDNRNTYLLTE